MHFSSRVLARMPTCSYLKPRSHSLNFQRMNISTEGRGSSPRFKCYFLVARTSLRSPARRARSSGCRARPAPGSRRWPRDNSHMTSANVSYFRTPFTHVCVGLTYVKQRNYIHNHPMRNLPLPSVWTSFVNGSLSRCLRGGGATRTTRRTARWA